MLYLRHVHDLKLVYIMNIEPNVEICWSRQVFLFYVRLLVNVLQGALSKDRFVYMPDKSVSESL